MIRSNLATRPFYNERAVRFWLLLAASTVAAATFFNVSRVLYYSQADTELATAAARDEARAAELRASAAQLRASVDTQQVQLASSEARQANELIDRRTFSWTELFNRFEATLPRNVRITSVQPRVGDDRHIILTVGLLARGVEDVDEFMENLEATGAFAELLSREEHVTEGGQLVSSLEAAYIPKPAAGSAAEPPAPAEGPRP